MKFGYARISTTVQDPSLQHDAFIQAGCDRVFTDRLSGSTSERPELHRMLEQVRNGDQVVVWRLDRLGRSLKDLIEWIQFFDEHGVGFQSLEENIDTQTPTGRLFFHIVGAFAQFERDLIRDRTQAGLDAARARGRVGGRPKSLTKSQIRMAREMYALQEMTVSEIGEALGVSRSTIYRALPSKLGSVARDASIA